MGPDGHPGDSTCGAFLVPYGTKSHWLENREPDSWLRCIASNGFGWDHVSVSLEDRCPTWPEMEFIRRTFFRPDEAAMQYHAPLDDYVDGFRKGDCQYCLHLWRPHSRTIPKPYRWMVGGMSPEEAYEAMRKDGF